MISEGDFVILDLVGIDKNNNSLVEEAKDKLEIIGYSSFPKKIEDTIKSGNENDEIKVELSPQEGYGEYNPNLIKTFPLSAFSYSSDLRVGDYVIVELEGKQVLGRIRFIGSGRIMIDFNDPRAGKYLEYRIKIKKIIKEEQEKLNALEKQFGVKISKEGGEIKVEGPEDKKGEVEKIIQKFLLKKEETH